MKVFAGQSDDPFFVDLGSTFDLLSIRKLPGNAGGGVNTTQGYNVHSLALQIPINQLTSNKATPTDSKDPKAVIGVWTTASRQSTSVLNTNATQTNSGDWIQVSRLGAPLVNEVVVPLAAKDLFNSSKPENDAQFANGVADPEVGKLLKGLYNIAVPPQGPFGSSTQRDDLEAIFLTGVPGLTKSEVGTPAEELRLNVAVPPTSADKISNLGVLGGDVQGYPNGRRLSDDVVDISLRAVAGAAYPLFHAGFVVDATGAKLGDGVDGNDKAFRNTFPYMALPSQGFESLPHVGLTVSAGGTTGGKPSSACMVSANLSFGSRGVDVSCLQVYLFNKGYLRVHPTGYFGHLTRKAVSEWQAAANLSANGSLSDDSKEAFNNR